MQLFLILGTTKFVYRSFSSQLDPYNAAFPMRAELRHLYISDPVLACS